jgi:pimeloyl-ACP methyl ester carboxylesterase
VWVPALVADGGKGRPRLAYGRSRAGPDPVVALHGITTTHRAFTTVARHLAHPSGMVGVDLRGRGDSGKPGRGNYGMHAHARDVVRLLDAIGLERAVVVGHSMGAFAATQTALDHPGRVRGLVLLDGGWPRAPLLSRGPRAEAAPLRAGLAKAFSRLELTFADLDALVDFWFPGAGLGIDDLPPDVADLYRYDLTPAPGGWRAKCSLTAARADARFDAFRAPTPRALGRLACPVALVRAGEGFAPGTPPTFTDALRASLVERVELRADVLLDGATHYSMLADQAHAARVAAVIDDLAATTAS